MRFLGKTKRLSVLRMVAALDSTQKRHLPYIYLATGIQDPLIHIVPGDGVRDSLYTAKNRYECSETPGKHAMELLGDASKRFCRA